MPKRLPSILLVDLHRNWGAELRNRLVNDKVRVHVVSSSHAAVALAQSKPLTAVVVDPDGQPQTGRLCRDLRLLGVRKIYSYLPSDAEYLSHDLIGELQRVPIGKA
jgi:hypothetical protein